LENIVVVERPTKKAKAGGYDVIDGRRRVKAARAAGLDRVPAMVYGAEEGQWRDVLTLALNRLRSDNPVSELAAIEALLKNGATMAQIGEATGLPKGTIEKRLKLGGLIAPIRKALTAGRIAVSVAEVVAVQPEEIQNELAGNLEGGGKITMANVKVFKTAERAYAIDQIPMSVFAGEAWQDLVARRLEETVKLLPEEETYLTREFEKMAEKVRKWKREAEETAGDWSKAEVSQEEPS